MSDTTSYLLREIPKDLWGEIRNLAYQEGISIRQLLLGELEDVIERERRREEADQILKSKSRST